MKKTVILPLITIILIAAMIFGGCNKSDNTDEKDKTDNLVVSETPAATATPMASATPMPSVSPEPEEDKYHISGEDLDQEVVAAFKEYIYEHTVSMGRFMMDGYGYYDVTGDGKPDLIKSVTHGSGIVSTGIFVYDIENKQGYQLQERGDYDYWVDSVKDGVLYIKKAYFGRMKLDAGAVGKLEFVDGELRYNGPEPDRSDLPTPVITKEPVKQDLVKVETELYTFELISRWSTMSSKLSIDVDDAGNVVIRSVEEPEKIYLRVTTVTDVDSAWALLGDENLYSYCIFSKDHIFVWQTPSEPLDTNLGLGYYEFCDLAKSMVILKDGETNEAINSIRPEYIKKYIELLENEEVLWPEIYNYGIEKAYGVYYNPLSDICFFALTGSNSSPLNMYIIYDRGEICKIEYPIETENRITSVFSFDYDNNGVKEYGIIPDYGYSDDGVEHAYDHLLIAERVEESSDYRVFEFESKPVADYIKPQLTLTVDPSDDHKAIFSLSGDTAVEVTCDFAIDEKDYELKYLCILEDDENNKDHFTAVLRANMPIKDGDTEYDIKYAPLVMVDVTYKGKGVFEASNITVKNWGKGLNVIEFFEENYLDVDERWDLEEETKEKLTEAAIKQGKTQEDIKTQNFIIKSIAEDGTVTLKSTYNPARVINDSGELSKDPEDYVLEEGLVPFGDEVVMKISEDCPIIYLTKDTGTKTYLLKLPELKILVDNYFFMNPNFAIQSSDPDNERCEYLHDFICTYMDGVIYYMSEQYYP